MLLTNKRKLVAILTVVWCHESSATAASLSRHHDNRSARTLESLLLPRSSIWRQDAAIRARDALVLLKYSSLRTFGRRRRWFTKPPVSSVRRQCELHSLSVGQTLIFLCHKNCAGLNTLKSGAMKCALESGMLLMAFTRGEPILGRVCYAC